MLAPTAYITAKGMTSKTNFLCCNTSTLFSASYATELLAEFNFPKRKELLTTRDVYCTGPLLEAVQAANVYPSSREFVDKKLKFSVSDVISNFHNLTKNFGGRRPAHEALRVFLEENFEDQEELEVWLPPDWSAIPNNLRTIQDERLRSWAAELNTIWKMLGRRVSEDVRIAPDHYSMIPLPHSFILASAKENELLYSNAYWILKGLLFCGMTISAKDVLKNLLYLVNTMGYIPKGNRIYYEGRSSPPMLPIMLSEYLKYTMDYDFLRENIELVEKEINFWVNNRTITVIKDGIEYEMFRYNVGAIGARPEAFREDMQSGTLADTEEELLDHFSSIQSASESGWTFSTRWFIVHGFNHGNRSNTATQYLIPVDLNAFMHRNFELLMWWHNRFGNIEKARHYRVKSEELLTAIEHVLWNDEVGIWQDYDLNYKKLRNYYYISNFTPLWTKSYTFHPEVLTQRVLDYLNSCKLDNYTGGIPTSAEYSGERWDFPNVWPPLQYILIKGLDKLCTPVAAELAFHFAEKFVQANYKAYNEHGSIFPTYDCLIPGRYGIGLQVKEASSGTLGVLFEFFLRWGNEFNITDKEE